MAIANSYPRIATTPIYIGAFKEYSFGRLNGFSVSVNPRRYESYQRVIGLLITPLDSTNVVAPRIQGFLQRVGQAIGDISGKIYNSNGSPVTLEQVDWTDVGPGGPWAAAEILWTDGAFVFPAVGSAPGDPFNVPIRIVVDTPGPIWLRMKVSY